RSRGVDPQLGVYGWFVGVVDTGEVLELAGPRLLVEPLRVALLARLNRRVHVDLDKRQAALDVQGTHAVAVLAVGADEGGDRDDARVGEQLGDLADAADVLFAVLGRETQVLVQPVPDVVAVEHVSQMAPLYKGMLQSIGNRALSRSG